MEFVNYDYRRDSGVFDDAYCVGTGGSVIHENYGVYNQTIAQHAVIDGDDTTGAFIVTRIDSLADYIDATDTIYEAWFVLQEAKNNSTSEYVLVRYCLKTWLEGDGGRGGAVEDSAVTAMEWLSDTTTPKLPGLWEFEIKDSDSNVNMYSCFGDTDYTGWNACSSGYGVCGSGGCYPFGSIIDTIYGNNGTACTLDVTDYARWAHDNDTSINIGMFYQRAVTGVMYFHSSNATSQANRPRLHVDHGPVAADPAASGPVKGVTIKGVIMKGPD
jgi:hypothetical protein